MYCTHSAGIVPSLGEYERFNNIIIDAYIGPVTQRFLDQLTTELNAQGLCCALMTMKADGGSALDWYAFDGLTLHAHIPYHLILEAHGGLMVRGEPGGWVGSPTFEPDGTGSAQCRELREDLGLWSAAAECAQRRALMPTFGAALESDGPRAAHLRVEYRRAVSRTASGLYPDAGGQAPGFGVNEEKLGGSLRGNFLAGGLSPWVAARWNFLVARVDEAQAGVRVAAAAHAVTAEWGYSFPTFDGDSIFNVFSSEPYQDVRGTYELWPGRGRLRLSGRGWARRFENGPGTGMATSALAGGGAVGARARFSPRNQVRLDLFYEDGHGGQRIGGDGSARWRLRRDLEVEGRLTLIQFDADLLSELEGLTFGVQGGATWIFSQGIALHLGAEENTNRFYASQFRLFAVLDLAFRPAP